MSSFGNVFAWYAGHVMPNRGSTGGHGMSQVFGGLWSWHDTRCLDRESRSGRGMSTKWGRCEGGSGHGMSPRSGLGWTCCGHGIMCPIRLVEPFRLWCGTLLVMGVTVLEGREEDLVDVAWRPVCEIWSDISDMACHTEEGGARAWHVVASEERGIPVGHGMTRSSLLLDIEGSLGGLAMWSWHDTFWANEKVQNLLIVDCHAVTILYIMMHQSLYTLYLDKNPFLWYNYSSRIVVCHASDMAFLLSAHRTFVWITQICVQSHGQEAFSTTQESSSGHFLLSGVMAEATLPIKRKEYHEYWTQRTPNNQGICHRRRGSTPLQS